MHAPWKKSYDQPRRHIKKLRHCFANKGPSRQWHPTPILLPGKSHGRRSLVGFSPWGRKESDTTKRPHFHFSLHALEKEMATHSSVLAWRIPGTEEPGGLPSMGSHRAGHDWSDLAAAAALMFNFRSGWLGLSLLLQEKPHEGTAWVSLAHHSTSRDPHLVDAKQKCFEGMNNPVKALC